MPFLTEEDGGRIKPANYHCNYTKEQGLEIIRCTNDPIYFIKKYVRIEHPTRGSVKFELFPFQETLIKCYNNNPRVIAMLSRQVGKTTTAAAYILWWSIFKDNQTILITSKDHDGAKEIINRLWYAYEELPWWIKPGVTKNQVHTKEFDNHSNIRGLATTKNSGRGKSNSLVYLDEFAFVPPGLAQDFWTSIYPTLSTGGRCIITSTPNTDEDKFSSIWFNSKLDPSSDEWEDVMNPDRKINPERIEEEPYDTIYETDDDDIREPDDLIIDNNDEFMKGFVAFHAHWTHVPGRDEKFKRQILSSGFSEEEWLREYECAFVSGDSTLISASKLAVIRSYVRKPRFIDKWGCRWYEDIKPNVGYAVVMDPSEGKMLDDACIQVWELPTLIQVAEWNSNNVDQHIQTKMLMRVLKRLYLMQENDPLHNGNMDIYYSVERNGLGIGVLNLIEEYGVDKFPGYLVDSTMNSMNVRGHSIGPETLNRWRGLITSASSKKRYCIQFKDLVERNLFVPKSQHLISQMKTFVKSGNSWAAKEGLKDDIVMSCVLMTHLIDEIKQLEPDLFDYLQVHLDENDNSNSHDFPLIPMIR